jgi:hypothetical protein
MPRRGHGDDQAFVSQDAKAFSAVPLRTPHCWVTLLIDGIGSRGTTCADVIISRTMRASCR